MSNFVLTLCVICWELIALNGELLGQSDLKISEGININKESVPNGKQIADEAVISPKRYDGAQLWRIPIYEQSDRSKIKDLWEKYEGQTWMEIDNNVDVLIQPTQLKEAESLLNTTDLTHVVLIEDLQRAIEDENPTPEEIEDLQNRKGHRMTWRAYHQLNDIHSYLNYLAQTYPDLCSVETIGTSNEQRALLLLKISNKKPGNKRFWIDGGMHAREWISPASVTYFIEQLVQNWESMPNYMRSIDWYILPVVNPDGYEYTHQRDRLWRKNRASSRGSGCSGVDLNRNFGYNWGGKGTSANSCSDIYKGSKPFSEPESAAMSRYMSKFGKNFFKAYVTIHSYGQYILYPWGHEAVVPVDNNELYRVGKQAAAKMFKLGGARYTVGSSGTTLYPAAGGSDDWAKGVLDIKYSYTLEMRDTGRYGFLLPAHMIETNGLETMQFVDTLAKVITSA